MSTESETILHSALQELLETFRTAKDFAVDQAPDVIQQMLFLHTVQAALLSLFLIVAAGMLYLAIATKVRDQEDERESLDRRLRDIEIHLRDLQGRS